MKTVKNLAMMLVVALSATAAEAMPSLLIDVEGGESAQLTPDDSGRYWNSTGSIGATPGVTVTNAVDQENNPTLVDLNVRNRFNSFNTEGTTSSSITDWDSEVTSDSWWIGDADTAAQLRFEGLTAGAGYDLTFYGSRNSSGVRSMNVTIDGITRSYNAETEGLTTFRAMVADASGHITADFDRKSGSNYAYLGAIEIVTDPEPPTVFIDFDGGDAPKPDSKGRYWNGTSGGLSGYVVTNAIDRDNNGTAVDINVTNGFQGNTGDGTTSSSLTDWDGAVTEDTFWLGAGNATAQIVIEDLIPGESYDLTFYGSRNVAPERSMDVTIGAITQSYDAQTEGLAKFVLVIADANGDITVDFDISSGSVNAYLGAIAIAPHIPEPSSLVLLAIGGLGLLGLRGRRRN